MSRPLRIEYPGAWYHVMNRGRRGEQIFESKKDFETFVSLLREASDLWSVRVSAYCLMGNHYHLLLQTPKGNLSRFMRHLNGVYTQKYNRRHGHDGQLFRGRYKSILVEEDSHLLELLRYIHRNPLRAGIVGEPNAYPWSSHHGYLSPSRSWKWIYKDALLAILTEDRNKKKAYLRFMDMEDSIELLELFNKKKWPSMLGSESFIAWVKEKFFEKKRDNQVPESLELAPERNRIIEEVCRQYRVKTETILKSQRGKSNEPRNVAIYLCRLLRNDTMRELGNVFGMTGYSPASSAVERVKKRLPKNRNLENTIQQIIGSIRKKGQDET